MCGVRNPFLPIFSIYKRKKTIYNVTRSECTVRNKISLKIEQIILSVNCSMPRSVYTYIIQLNPCRDTVYIYIFFFILPRKTPRDLSVPPMAEKGEWKGNKNKMRTKKTRWRVGAEWKKKIHWILYKTCPCLHTVPDMPLYCRKMPTEGFKWLSKRQPYLIYGAIVVQKTVEKRTRRTEQKIKRIKPKISARLCVWPDIRILLCAWMWSKTTK